MGARDSKGLDSNRLLVVSATTWMWVLALIQVGHCPKSIDVLCTTEEAKRNLDALIEARPLPLEELGFISSVELAGRSRWQLVVLEEGDELLRSDLQSVVDVVGCAPRWVWVGSRAGAKQVQSWAPRGTVTVRTITHSQLGGSTRARAVIAWGSDRQNAVTIGRVRYPTRPSGDWIKLAAPLEFGRRTQKESPCWDAASKRLFPWPFPNEMAIISVPSVFFPKGGMVTRRLVTCEQAQLLDLPAHWNPSALRTIWGWRDGKALPLRIPVEFLLSARAWYDASNLIPVEAGDNPQGGECGEHVLTAWARTANESFGSTKFDMSQAGWLWEPNLGNEVTVATKGDSAGVDTSQWGVGGPDKEGARTTIRNWLLTRWRLRVTREALAQVRQAKNIADGRGSGSRTAKPPIQTDPRFKNTIRDCVRRSANANWWEWSDGSTLYFWRWPQEWQEEALKGAKAFHTSRPPRRLRARTVPVESELHATLLVEKVKKLIDRRYVIPASEGAVWCVIPFFVVPKGEFDIRVVWSDTENGVNPSIVAPTFFMPLPDTLFRRVPNDAFIGDIDVGEMFHNFPLHPSEQAYAGIRLSDEQAEALGVTTTLFVWDRLLFGWRPSPYFSVRMMTRAVEIAQGNHLDKKNPFAWDRVIFNLPGQSDYDPGKPWIMKWRTWDGTTPCEVVFFVDDGRIIGPNELMVRLATRQVAAVIQYLGIQDASRKRRPVSQRPGAWAGTVVFTDCGLPRKFVTQKKWDKVKKIVDWLSKKIDSKLGLPYKELLSYRGFLVHISLTYTFMKPYLKGLHLTVESWREKYNTPGLEGWPDPEYRRPVGGGELFNEEDAYIEEAIAEKVEDTEEHPKDKEGKVSPSADEPLKPVPRLASDVKALRTLFETEKPAMIPLRPVSGKINYAYGFVDASGSGFGGTWRNPEEQTSNSHTVEARHGFWCAEVSEASSNYREFRNLVEHVEGRAKSGLLIGKEVWIYTDNMVTELVVFTGTSKSPTLFELVLRLRKLERDGQFALKVVHVAGTRMIHEGTDGLSRGQVDVHQLTDHLASRVPLHLASGERCGAVNDWLNQWLGTGTWTRGEPEDWFDRAQKEVTDTQTGDVKTWVWDLPPSGAEHILEELALARLKRHDSMRGVVLIPGLMRPFWFRRFSRTVDAYFTVPVGSDCWPSSMHEPLIVGVFFPLLCYRPWDWKKAPALVAGVRKVQALYKTDCLRGRDLLRQLWTSCLWVQGMPERLVRKLLSNGHAGPLLGVAAKGRKDCFRRMFKREPVIGTPGDDTVLDFIRRANLDAFWSRAPATVEASRRSFMEQVRWADNLGFEMFDPRGPLPTSYDSGMRTAIAVLQKSTQPGRHEETQKFSSARKARVIHTNMFKTSTKGLATSVYGRVDNRRIVHGISPVDMEFYTMFTKGFEYRVGQRIRRDMAVSIEVMCQFQVLAEKLWSGEEVGPPIVRREKREIAEWACYFLFAFCHSLRGFEVVKATIKDLQKQIGSHKGEEYIGLPLLGRFKNCGNTNERMLCFMVGRTDSGLEPAKWVRRLLNVLDQESLKSDWLFQDTESGDQRKMTSFNDIFYEFLAHVQRYCENLIPDDIDVTEEYFLGRSFRRGATTRAQNAGVSESDINWVNRWGTGTELVVKGPMRVVYSERTQLLDTYLRFSRAL